MSIYRTIFKKLNIPNDPMNIMRFGLIIFWVIFICGILVFSIDYSDFPRKIDFYEYILLLTGVCGILSMFFSMKHKYQRK